MTTLCEVTLIDRVEKHPDADTLDIVYFGDFKTICRLDSFKVGDYGIYMSPGAILTDSLLIEMGLWDYVKRRGVLAGSGNRIKPKKLRGVVSEGIMHGPFTLEEVCFLTELDDPVGAEVKQIFGVTKFDPNVFDSKTGRRLGRGDPDFCFTALSRDVHKYDIENVKKHGAHLAEYFQTSGRECVITSKIHGCWAGFKLIDNESRPEGAKYDPTLVPDNLLVSSKGRIEKGNMLRPTGVAFDTVWWQVAKSLDLVNRCPDIRAYYGEDVTILGEIYGVQDLKYGVNTVDNINDLNYAVTEMPDSVPFRVFDVYVGDYGNGRYLDNAELDKFCCRYMLPRVPVLYVGPYDRAVVQRHTDGMEDISGQELHIREGVVVRDSQEGGNCRGLGRVQVKSISDDYLTRQNGSEFN